MAEFNTDEQWSAVFKKAVETINPDSPSSHLEIPADLSSPSVIASYIDHTLLKLDATGEQIDAICKEAKDEEFAAVCVRLPFVPRAKAALAGSNVKVACVVGFHEGTHPTAEMVVEGTAAVSAGADELDVVLNREVLLSKRYSAVCAELSALRAASPPPVVIKLILETSQLTAEDIIAATVLAGHAGLDFVKTSTGFCGRGASVDDVKLMSAAAAYVAKLTGRAPMKVKASGGVRTLEDAVMMIKTGAERIGASAGVAIVQEAKGAASKGPVLGAEGY